jgi:hypothetical protein
MAFDINPEFWDIRQQNAFNLFICAMISKKKEDYVLRKALGCWSEFLNKIPEDVLRKIIDIGNNSKIV